MDQSLIDMRTGSQKQTLSGEALVRIFTTKLVVLTAQNATGHISQAIQELGGENLQCAAASRKKLSSGVMIVPEMMWDSVEISAPHAVKQLFWATHHSRPNADVILGSSDKFNSEA